MERGEEAERTGSQEELTAAVSPPTLRELVERFDIGLTENSPLGNREFAPSGNPALLFNEENFPVKWWRDTRSRRRAERQGGKGGSRLFSVNYETRRFKLGELCQIKPESLTLLPTLSRLQRMRYGQRVPTRVTMMKDPRPHSTWLRKYILSHAKRDKLEVDYATGYPSGDNDYRVATYLGYLLASPSSPFRPVRPEGPENEEKLAKWSGAVRQLRSTCEQHGLVFKPALIRLGFTELVKPRVLAIFFENNRLDENSLPEFFSTIAYWKVALTAEILKGSQEETHIFPFPSHIYEPKNLPHPEFIPSMIDAFWFYLWNLPEIISPGSSFNKDVLPTEVDSLYRLAYTTVDSHFERGSISPEAHRQLFAFLDMTKPHFQTLLKYYQDNPRELIKEGRQSTRPGRPSNIPSSGEIRAEILKAGGSATTITTNWRTLTDWLYGRDQHR